MYKVLNGVIVENKRIVYRSNDLNELNYISSELNKRQMVSRETYKPTNEMKVAANRALKWREEFKRGGTRVGLTSAKMIVGGKSFTATRVKRMFSFFSRHEVDKKAEGFNKGEKGYPSNGRIAWDLWGGDAGFSWSKKIADKLRKERFFLELSVIKRMHLHEVVNEVEYILAESNLSSPIIMDFVIDEKNYFVLADEGVMYRFYFEVKEGEIVDYSLDKIETRYSFDVKTNNEFIRRENGLVDVIGIASASTLNRSGQIDTKSLFKSFISKYNSPKSVNIYHNRKLIVGYTNKITYYDKFLLVHLTIDTKTELGKAALFALQNGWGFSIEFWSTRMEYERINGVNILKHTKGIFDGIAILKESDAASLFTKGFTSNYKKDKEEK